MFSANALTCSSENCASTIRVVYEWWRICAFTPNLYCTTEYYCNNTISISVAHCHIILYWINNFWNRFNVRINLEKKSIFFCRQYKNVLNQTNALRVMKNSYYPFTSNVNWMRQFKIPDVSLRDNDVMIMTWDFSQACPFLKLDFNDWTCKLLRSEVGHDYQGTTACIQSDFNRFFVFCCYGLFHLVKVIN